MSKYAFSIIVSCYNRGDLMSRAFETWANQDIPKNLYEIIVVDDGSDDNTSEIVRSYKNTGLNLKLIRLEKEPDKFRGHTIGYNKALLLSEADFCLFTHPEIMFPKNLLTMALKWFEKRHLLAKVDEGWARMPYLAIKPLWLPEGDYDSVNWKDNVYRLMKFLDFDQDMEGLPIDYRAQTQIMRSEWGSTTTFIMRRTDLANIGGFIEFDCWGPDDINMEARRRVYNMNSSVLDGVFVIHQNHDNHRATKRIDINEVFRKNKPVSNILDAQGPLNLNDFKPF